MESGNPPFAVETDRIRLAAGSAFLSVSLAGIFLLARAGFSPLPPSSVLGVLSVSFLLLFAPIAAGQVEARWALSKGSTRFRSHARYSLLALAFVLLCSYLGEWSGFVLILIIAANAFFSVVILSFRPISFSRMIRELAPLMVLVPFTVWIASEVWGMWGVNPLFTEKFVVGNGNVDTLFHIAIGNMIATYGVASTGLDALTRISYHYGSHFYFARLSLLLRLRVLDVYNFAVPVVFYPLFVNAFGSFVIDLRKTRLSSKPLGIRFWLVVALFHVGFIPAGEQRTLRFGPNLPMHFESYLAGAILFFLFSSFVFELFENRPLPGQRESAGGLVSLFLVCPLMVGILGFTKVSFMYLALVLAVYFAFRLGLVRAWEIGVSLILSSAVFIVVQRLTSSWGPVPFKPFAYLRDRVPKPLLALFFFTFFLWPWALFFSRVKEAGIRTIGELLAALRSRALLDVEAVFVLAAFGMLPGLVLAIPHGGAVYFFDPSTWFALACFLVFVEPKLPAFPDLRGPRCGSWSEVRLWPVLIGGLVAVLLTAALGNVCARTHSFFVDNLDFRGSVIQCSDLSFDVRFAARRALASRRFADVGAFADRIASNGIQRDLAACRPYRSVSTLLEIGRLPRAEKKESILFVPQSVRPYWELDRRNRPSELHCSMATPFIGPALTGVVVLGGVPSVVPYRVEEAFLRSNVLDAAEKNVLASITVPDGNGDRLLDFNADGAKIRQASELFSERYGRRFQWYGYQDYEHFDVPRYPDANSLGKAMNDARALGFRKLIVLEEREGELAHRTVDLYP